MDVFIRATLSAIMVAGIIGYALRFRKWIPWISCLALVAVLEIGAFWFDAVEVSIEAFLGAIVTLLISKVIYTRDAKPTISFVVCTFLITAFLLDVVIGPKLRGAKEVGRRQIPAPQIPQEEEDAGIRK